MERLFYFVLLRRMHWGEGLVNRLQDWETISREGEVINTLRTGMVLGLEKQQAGWISDNLEQKKKEWAQIEKWICMGGNRELRLHS